MDSYWHSRQTLADAAMEKDERALSLRVHNAYESELRRLNREIAEYYQRYGENGVLEYRRLMETMDPKDRELLIRDCDEFLRQHPDMQSIVDVRKSIYQLNRLEGLQASARLHLYQATGDVVQRIDNHIMRQSLRGANTAAEAMGFGRSFYSMDSDAVRRFVDTVWMGNTSYSQRIWDNTETLASYVAQDMSKALARGDSYQRIAKALEKRFVDVPQSSLMRLVYTEGTYVSRMAQVEELKREGFDSYTIEVVHDERACEECEGVNGSTFRFEDMQVGVNFPPLHPYCRCQIAPAVDDWDAWQQKQEEGEGKKVEGIRDLFARKRINKKEAVYTKLEAEHKKLLNKRLKRSNKTARNLYFKNEHRFLAPDYLDTYEAYYDPVSNKVGIDLRLFDDGKREAGDTWFHEFGHNIDYLYGSGDGPFSYLYEDGAFRKALSSDANKAIQSLRQTLINEGIAPEDLEDMVEFRMFEQLAGLSDAEAHAVSDMFDAATKGVIKGIWGHPYGYWDEDGENQSTEGFAEMFAGVTGSDISLSKIKEYFPQAFEVFLKMIEEMGGM